MFFTLQEWIGDVFRIFTARWFYRSSSLRHSLVTKIQKKYEIRILWMGRQVYSYKCVIPCSIHFLSIFNIISKLVCYHELRNYAHPIVPIVAIELYLVCNYEIFFAGKKLQKSYAYKLLIPIQCFKI